ncbi:unnamed protein product [Nippostrongylus brasiliensis]|uniref:Myosin N-terminal SH3-like domain-containing protein n=1 Tax=Nippostrongylus brasiliensis TaxID=27835 RepID=A0A0N4YRZ5_NIPBR|nr:unnamed protein product [Nippostrongylus brasiliensis]
MAVPSSFQRANARVVKGRSRLRMLIQVLSLQDQSRPYDSKKNCWVPDAEEGYIEGIIKKTAGDDVTVSLGQGNEKVFKKDMVQEMNPPKFEKTEDMSNLTFLNDASVLHNLRSRYSAMLIYVSFHFHKSNFTIQCRLIP